MTQPSSTTARPLHPAPTAPRPLARRQVLAAAAATAAAVGLPGLGWSGAARAQEGAIKIAQSTALTGPLGDLGSAMH